MIKILLLIATVALITLLGVFLSAGKKKRSQVFAELYEFNEQLLINLKYSRKPLDEVAKNYKFMPAVIKGEKVLGGNDAAFISDYATGLGKSDAMSQIDYLNDRKSALLKLKDESFADYKKYGSLYVKIFFMVGVLLAILMA